MLKDYAQSVISALSDAVTGGIGAFLHDSIENISGAIGPTVRLCAALYIVMYGILIVRGAVSEPFMDLVMRLMKVTIIVALATRTDLYNQYVMSPLFVDVPTGLARALSGENGDKHYFAILFGRVTTLGFSIYDKSSGTFEPIAAMLIAVAVIISGAIYCLIGQGLLLGVQLALGVLVGIGPIFVGLMLFSVTRTYFSGWLNQVVNFLVLYLLILAVGLLLTTAVTKALPTIQGSYSLGDLLYLGATVIGVMGIGAGSLVLMPFMAAGIAGGSALNLLSAAQQGMRPWKRGQRELGHAANGAKKLVGDFKRAVKSLRGGRK